MKITVTAEDITNGKRLVSSQCPIALGVRRALPDTWAIYVEPNTISIYLGHDRKKLQTPPAAAAFVMRFDNGDPVKPFEFDLDVPPDLLPGVTQAEGSAA